MKSLQITKTARVFLLLGPAACIFTSSCAMSEKKSGEVGALVGTVIGGVGGYKIANQHGKSKGNKIAGAILGGVAGAAAGQEVGKKSSKLKGLEDVQPF